EEYEGNVVFLHEIKEGAAEESYGIHVAKLADLPGASIDRANTILHEVESKGNEQQVNDADEKESAQLSFFVEEQKSGTKVEVDPAQEKVIQELRHLNLFEMNPLEAMNELQRLQKDAKK